MLSESEAGILLDQIAANLQKLQWAAAAMNQPQLSYLIDVALGEALAQLYAHSPDAQPSIALPAEPSTGGMTLSSGAAEQRSREALVRRIAQRRGFKLIKSRRRDRLARDFEKYVLIDIGTNRVMCGGEPYYFSSTLAEIEQYLGFSR